jgi:hypothetical protein
MDVALVFWAVVIVGFPSGTAVKGTKQLTIKKQSSTIKQGGYYKESLYISQTLKSFKFPKDFCTI